MRQDRWNRFAVALCGALAWSGCDSSDGDGEPADDELGATKDEGKGEPRDDGDAKEPDEAAAGDGASAAGSAADKPEDSEPDGLRIVPSLRGDCDLQTQYAGDEACLAAPDPEEGFQIHVGPADHDDPAQVAPFLMQPGDESSQCYYSAMPNDEDVHYFVFEMSGRPGTHHIINTLVGGGRAEGFAACGGLDSMGTISGASRPHIEPAPVPPENEGLGYLIPANLSLQSDMHYFNLTDEPIVREFWLNLYYVKELKEVAGRIAGLGGFGWNFAPIQPGTHQVYPYECPIEGDGRIVQLIGHTHAHAIRETAHVRRANGDRVKVFEQYDYLEPQIFNYNSLVENPDFSASAAGAFTGILEVSAGDVLEWECEVNNDSDAPLRYTNQVQTGEMCNIWGTTVGPNLRCFLQ